MQLFDLPDQCECGIWFREWEHNSYGVKQRVYVDDIERGDMDNCWLRRYWQRDSELFGVGEHWAAADGYSDDSGEDVYGDAGVRVQLLDLSDQCECGFGRRQRYSICQLWIRLHLDGCQQCFLDNGDRRQ